MEKLKKKDMLLLAAIIAAGLVILLLAVVLNKPGSKIRISVDGKSIGEWSLSEDNRIDIPLRDGEKNVLVIENGQAYMEEANCPDGLCIKMGKIHITGESIICLPHNVSAEVIGEGNTIDGVVR